MSMVARIHDDRPVLPRIVMMRGHTGTRGSEEEHECQGRGAVPRDRAHAAVSYGRRDASNEGNALDESISVGFEHAARGDSPDIGSNWLDAPDA
jgi:hypothetical protein